MTGRVLVAQLRQEETTGATWALTLMQRTTSEVVK
jgi:hypothetical protein